MIKKHPKADLNSYHTLILQGGLIVILLITIAATHLEFKQDTVTVNYQPETDEPFTPIDIPITKTIKPAPAKPSVFIEVPESEPIDVEDIDFGPEDIFAGGNAIPMPPEQDVTDDEPVEIFMLEKKPEIKGGLAALYKLINYPKLARQAGIEGRVYVEFVIDKQGNVTRPTIIRGIGGGCNEEVLRVIKLVKFTPGIQNGNFVQVKMRQAVNFKLEN
ncbi:MAG TPA: energy transducer TonB [Balneolaceae bacterium]|nr:energy transducer TonB [Balneolaceae bacterium]|tara:strand:- start:39099 stop:39749 length:651 start_codon:yes stop_codon:yes gene_type:complete